MSIFERYKKLIEDHKEQGTMTDEFISQTKERLEFYLNKGKISENEYKELIEMLKANW